MSVYSDEMQKLYKEIEAAEQAGMLDMADKVKPLLHRMYRMLQIIGRELNVY